MQGAINVQFIGHCTLRRGRYRLCTMGRQGMQGAMAMFKRSHPHNVDAYDTFRRGASNSIVHCALASLGGMWPMLKGSSLVNLTHDSCDGRKASRETDMRFIPKMTEHTWNRNDWLKKMLSDDITWETWQTRGLKARLGFNRQNPRPRLSVKLSLKPRLDRLKRFTLWMQQRPSIRLAFDWTHIPLSLYGILKNNWNFHWDNVGHIIVL